MTVALLSSEYLRHADDSAPSEGLEEQLTGILRDCEKAWSGLDVEPARFAARLGECARRFEGGLARLHTADLYLAFACLMGSDRALAGFEKRYMRDLSERLSRKAASAASGEEVCQALRVLLFTGDKPRIADYRGRGPLRGWLRLVAIRTASNLTRRLEEQADARVDPEPLVMLGPDPEMDFLRARNREDFQQALQETVAALSTDQRNALRMHYLEGLTVEQIGALFRVNKSTISRWISNARQTVLDRTREALRSRLGATSSEIDSLLGGIQSQLDLSLSRILRAGSSSGPK
jgi:RNA polymerase sigma-70 factor (ECF subfamily)